eukprot:13827985-Ditylum_brightwellii.AAC.1
MAKIPKSSPLAQLPGSHPSPHHQPHCPFTNASHRAPQTMPGQPTTIRDGLAIVVSNGLHKEGCSGAAFAIEGACYNCHQISGSCTAPGYIEDHDAYCGELSGLYSIVTTVENLCTHYGIALGAITVACDGIEVLKKSMDAETSFECCSSHFHLIAAINAILQCSKIIWYWKHVKGRQDVYHSPLDR